MVVLDNPFRFEASPASDTANFQGIHQRNARLRRLGRRHVEDGFGHWRTFRFSKLQPIPRRFLIDTGSGQRIDGFPNRG